jgi:hypothetical protein
MSIFYRRVIFSVAITVILSLSVVAVWAQGEQPNVGILRLESFKCPKQVFPGSDFHASIDVRYAVRGQPNNATIRAAIYSGEVNFSNPLWQSNPQVVENGGDKVWNVTVKSPTTEGDFRLTAWAFYLDKGTWNFYSNSTSGPSFLQVTVKISRTASLSVVLGVPDVVVSFDNTSVKTSSDGYAQMTLLLGSNHVVSVPPLVELQNSTRLVFGGWSDRSNQTQRAVLLDGDSKLVGSYVVQYLLHENSIVSDYSHSSWYDAGSNVSLHVEPSVGGFLGLRYVFRGWSGDLGSTSTSVSLVMDKPKVVNADFVVDYSPLVIPIILVIGIVGGIFLAILMRRKRGPALIEEDVSGEEVQAKFCDGCGEPVEEDWTHCIRCGRELRSPEPVEG